MRKGLLVCAALLAAVLLITLPACSQRGSAGSAIKATWITPGISGETVSISAGEVEQNTITHFKVSTPTADMAFMAYKFDGETYVRANICPPCRSEGFSLKKDKLVCDTCSTEFNARNGAGISGACVAYPKAPVSYKVDSGKIVMNGDDLVTAFQTTLTRR